MQSGQLLPDFYTCGLCYMYVSTAHLVHESLIQLAPLRLITLVQSRPLGLGCDPRAMSETVSSRIVIPDGGMSSGTI